MVFNNIFIYFSSKTVNMYVHNDYLTCSNENRCYRYPGLSAGPSEALSPIALSAGGTDASSGSFWDDDSWATMSVSVRQGSLEPEAVDGVQEDLAQRNDPVASKLTANTNLTSSRPTSSS